MKKGAIGAIGLGAVLLIALLVFAMCLERIPAGYHGIVYDVRNGISGEVLSQGFKIVAPTKKVTVYSTGLEQSYLTADKVGDSPYDESFKTPTADGKSLTVSLEFSYRFALETLPETFTLFKGQSGTEIKETFIKPKIKAWTQEVTAKYPVTEVFGDKRQELNEALDVYLKEKFKAYGIVIDTVNFTDIQTDPETAAAIQKKVNAQQELELANIEAETAKIQAEKDKQVAIIQAEKDKETAAIEAEKAKIKAQGEADARMIAAEAEAAANKLVSDSLTPELLEQQKIEKWKGDVPQVQGSSTPIINMAN